MHQFRLHSDKGRDCFGTSGLSSCRAGEFGLKIPSVDVDFAAVLKRAKDILMRSRTGLDRGFEHADNPTLVRGHAKLDGREGSRFKLRIGEARLTAEQVVLDTGTHTALPSIAGFPRRYPSSTPRYLPDDEFRPAVIASAARHGPGQVAAARWLNPSKSRSHRRLYGDLPIQVVEKNSEET